jgi:alkyldihydroxyacetonephosphate synthase
MMKKSVTCTLQIVLKTKDVIVLFPQVLGQDATAALAARLIQVLGEARVLTDSETLDAYSHDAWPVTVLQQQQNLHPNRPEIVVRVDEPAQVGEVLALAREARSAVTTRGLGSSVTGQALPVVGGIVLDMSSISGEPELDEKNLTVSAPSGTRGSDIEAWLQGRGFTSNFFPQSLMRSTIGGWIATRATGQLSSRYGGIEDSVVRYTVILSDGSQMSVGQKPRASVGPDLKELFLGSEGMFGIILDVTMKIYRLSPERISEAWLLPSVEAGLNALREIYQAGIRPSLMRFYDSTESRFALQDDTASECAMFLTHEGLQAIAHAEHEESRRIVEGLGGRSIGSGPVNRWYERRFDFSTVEQLIAEDGGYAETIEVAHLWTGIEELYTRLTEALAPLSDEVLGHFSHVYPQGVSLYVILLGRAESNKIASARLAEIWRIAMKITTELGGELSHHHGAGLARQEFIPQNLGEQHQLIRRLKETLDPVGILNPGHLGL